MRGFNSLLFMCDECVSSFLCVFRVAQQKSSPACFQGCVELTVYERFDLLIDLIDRIKI